jgi:RNA polymerase sigma-70 factor (ECF subfamily)
MDTAPHEIDLLTRVRDAGDTEAFGDLFRKYQPVVFRSTFFRLRDSDLTHEVVQETFVRIWDHRSSIRPRLPFLALALRIAQNIIRDMARHAATRERLASEIPPPALSDGDDPAEATALAMLEERIAHIITTQLGERCRTVFLLSRYEGMSHREISGILGISEKTVENQITKALKVLGKALPR